MSILKATNHPLPAHVPGRVITVPLNCLLDYYSTYGLEPIKYVFPPQQHEEVMIVGKIGECDLQPEKL